MGKDLFNDRISRFSIRKLNVGVCSVLLGTLVMVGTASSVAADENAENPATVATTSEAPATLTATSAAETTSTAATTYEASPAVTSTAASTSEASSTSTAASATSTAALLPKHQAWKLLHQKTRQ
ncbi:YSIRK-type signal peptide-containing protein [Streptococcus sp. KHUD_013]|uniref:YSIRK-type signal peptide-containing protein n=1 Tax=Streptococcus sp. KHUD_013 TaxID=3413147 RepID=UPI00403FD545